MGTDHAFLGIGAELQELHDFGSLGQFGAERAKLARKKNATKEEIGMMMTNLPTKNEKEDENG